MTMVGQVIPALLQWTRHDKDELACLKIEFKSQANFDNGEDCNYCHESGDWKAQCLVLQASQCLRGVMLFWRSHPCPVFLYLCHLESCCMSRRVILP